LPTLSEKRVISSSSMKSGDGVVMTFMVSFSSLSGGREVDRAVRRETERAIGVEWADAVDPVTLSRTARSLRRATSPFSQRRRA
jgi:hypothetical protein